MKKVMMKTVLASLVVSSITVLTGCVTSPDMEAAKQPLGSIVSVVNVPGVKKDALYSSSKIWVAKVFTDSNSVIQYADKEEGSIVGKGNVKYPCDGFNDCLAGLAPIFPYTFYHLTHYWFAAADIPVANDTPVHYADAIRCNVRRPPQGSLPLLTRRVSA